MRLFSFLEQNAYLRVFINTLEIKHLEEQKLIRRKSKNEFSSSRLLLANFQNFEFALREIIQELKPDSYFKPMYNMIIQPMEKKEGGLCSVELKAFKEAGESAGGKFVRIYTGDEMLNDDQVIKYLDARTNFNNLY